MDNNLELVKYDDPILRSKAYGITELTPKVYSLARDMIKFMYKNNGIGLAAPQVGLPIRLFVMHMFTEDKEELIQGSEIDSGQAAIIINPKLVSGEEEVTFKEGCLSFPDITVPVKRYGKIVMSSASLQDGEYSEITLTGINAICAQHEMDHLDGITFLDKLPRQERRSALRKLKKK